MAKGNDGSAARRRTMRKLLIAASVALGVTFVLIYSESKAGGMAGSPSQAHTYYDEPMGRKERKRRHDLGGDRNARHGGPDGEMHRAIARGFGGRDRNYYGGAHARGYSGSGDDSGDSGDDGHGFRKFGRSGYGMKASKARFKRGKGGGYPHPRIQEVTDDVSESSDGDPLAIQYRKDLIGEHNIRKREEALEGILNGSVNLIALLTGHDMKPSNDASYQGIGGKFCKVDFALHKNDPSSRKYINSSFRALYLDKPNGRVCNIDYDQKSNYSSAGMLNSIF